jgi:hypothetical protein
MKKIIVLLLFLAPLLVFATEEASLEGLDEPQWKDFAPIAYVDVKEPKGLNKFNDVVAYWYKRKAEFDENIEKCRAIEHNDDKIRCYQDLKVKQYQKNSDYNARIEAMERERMNPAEMQDPMTNMYPLGGLLQNFGKFQPNELH